MCGRLSSPINKKIQAFPISSWRNEFQQAKNIGFESMEWVFDLHDNPIMCDDGVTEIITHSKKTGVEINSLCADYFMEKKLFGVSTSQLQKNIDVLLKLIAQCRKSNISILELPFVDVSSLKADADREQILKNLGPALRAADDNEVIIALETDLPPDTFKELLIKFDHPKIMANYDVGNSTSNCYDISKELKVLKNWIINVHVKDRLKKGHTVPLGTGDTDFETFFSSLDKINYKGELIIQGAREDLTDNRISAEYTCKKYLTFVKQYVDKYLRAT